MQYLKLWTLLLMAMLVQPRNADPIEMLAKLGFYLLYGHRHATPPVISPPIQANTDDIIRHYGYPAENHDVVTEDGYVITMHRIPHHKNSKTTFKKEPIIIIPGLLGSSLFYMIRGEQGSTALTFSKAGYDVWLQNYRGSRYGKKHTTLSPEKDRQFWNFSFHEQGTYDITASVDYVLSVTKTKQVYLFGHSQGGTCISIFLAERTDYNKKIKAAFLLAPAIKMPQTKFPFGQHQVLANILLPIFHEMEIFPYMESTANLASYFCADPDGQKVCALFMSSGAGTDLFNDKLDVLYDIIRMMSGTSVKNIRHHMQVIKRAEFAQYDYGKHGNIIQYGQENPPNYNIGNITTPISLFYSDNDEIVNWKDTINAIPLFPKGTKVTLVKGFSHFDFTVSRHAKILVLEPIIDEMAIIEHQYMSSLTITSSMHIIILLVFLIIMFLVFLVIQLPCGARKSHQRLPLVEGYNIS